MYKLPDLPYEYNALEPFIDEETMRVHHDGHHATYVKNLNDLLLGHEEFLDMEVEGLLKSLNKIPEDIRLKVKNNAGGHYHHSLFWEIMTPNRQDKPKGKLLEAINEKFGDFEKFKDKFTQSALGLFGSGWTWLVLDKDNLEIANIPNQDSPVSIGHYPIFAIDLWEHAYYLKYKNKRADYIEAWWNVVNWEEAERRYLKAF
ncbi:MAG: superoxide dismutase [Actinobacteria bacterium]|nr:superoxide dismutase [Actinomycetota bacterium]